MQFWRSMPPGLNLKSLAFATSVYVPEPGHTFPEWCRQHGLEDFEPCTMEAFTAYGLAMQSRFVPNLEPQDVARVAQSADGFDLTLSNGERLGARKVVCATGLGHLAHMPQPMMGLPPERAAHTSTLSDYASYRGQTVAVIGGGASAIEAGALVHEAGGSAEVLVRDAGAVFHTRTPRVRPLIERIKEPMTVLGASRKHWVLEKFPLAVHFVPEAQRIAFVKRYAGPSSPWWIKDRVIGKVPIHAHATVVSAKATASRVNLQVRMGDGSQRNLLVDRVIAGTGFVSDVSRLPYLDSQLSACIRRTDLAPTLSLKFESSVEGLYFVGPISAMSFGPLFRFVCGADYTVRALARHLGGSLAKPRRSVRERVPVEQV